MANLMNASNEWANRPDDERFADLPSLLAACKLQREASATRQIPLEDVAILPHGGSIALFRQGNDTPVRLSHWSFDQLAKQSNAPAYYLRTLPPELAAQCLQTGLRKSDDALKGLFLKRESGITLRAVTSLSYDRVWDADIVTRAMELEGKGWKVPPARPCREGQRGTRKATAKDVLNYSRNFGLGVKEGDEIAPAGLYRGDRDLFIFMVDESRPIMEPGAKGPKFRGFFLRNSEVGAATLDLTCFLYDAVCGNHIIWGATNVSRIVARHIHQAATRAFPEIVPALRAYSGESEADILSMLTRARGTLLGKDEDETIAAVWKRRIVGLNKAHIVDAFAVAKKNTDTKGYGDPRSVYGMVSGLTELSQREKNADDRYALDVAASKLLSA